MNLQATNLKTQRNKRKNRNHRGKKLNQDKCETPKKKKRNDATSVPPLTPVTAVTPIGPATPVTCAGHVTPATQLGPETQATCTTPVTPATCTTPVTLATQKEENGKGKASHQKHHLLLLLILMIIEHLFPMPFRKHYWKPRF